jgi:hypothetical protein
MTDETKQRILQAVSRAVHDVWCKANWFSEYRTGVRETEKAIVAAIEALQVEINENEPDWKAIAASLQDIIDGKVRPMREVLEELRDQINNTK